VNRNTILTLQARSTTKGKMSSTQNGVPTDIPIGFDQYNHRTPLGRFNCCGKSRCTRSDDNDIRFLVPYFVLPRFLSLGLTKSCKRCGTERSCLDKRSARWAFVISFGLVHSSTARTPTNSITVSLGFG
jgi:hypothetical protein